LGGGEGKAPLEVFIAAADKRVGSMGPISMR